MSQPSLDIRRDLVRNLLPPALLLFLVPAASFGLAKLGSSMIGGEYLTSIEQNITGDAALTPEQRAGYLQFYKDHPPQSMCADPDPERAEYRQATCGPWSELWQFHQAARVSLAALGMGIVGVSASLGLAVAAAWSRSAQYASFVFGSRLLRALAVAEIVVQGALAVWCSFWITALGLHIYVPKLILIVAVFAGAGMWAAIRGIFRKPPERGTLEAVAVPESDAPDLWARIRAIASQIGTAPPTHLVAGIDDNFFVTQAPLQLHETAGAGPVVPGQRLTGRTLYVSLPLLRIMERQEAEAVLSHELAHFRGGDTAANARLGPELVRFDAYLDTLARELVTLPAFHLLHLFRMLFEVALARERRERELLADRTAAEVTSPLALARSLLKISAYSSYRRSTEEALYAHTRVHEEALGIAERVSAGLGAHVASSHFKDDLANASVPHPFDSHPVISERFANVGVTIADTDYADLLLATPEQSWAHAVTTAEAIESRLWGAFEARLAQSHELQLAYRYLPATDAERELVLRHFPAVTFNGSGTIRVSIDGLGLPDGRDVGWDEVSTVGKEDGTFTKALTIHLKGKPMATIDLRRLQGQAAAFEQAFGRYWQRHQIMRQLQITDPVPASG